MQQSLKDKIKQNFWGQYAVSLLHCAESRFIPMLIDDETAVKRYYKKCSGKELDLENSQTFSEKLNWYKLNHRDPLMQQCADKLAVRDYVIEKGYGDCLNELLGVYDNANDIDLDVLPNQFVLKATHGSHMNLIVKDKSKVNWKQQRLLMNSWLKQDIYWSGREWVYKDIPRKIIAEKYLEDQTGELKDYKFFCFNGVPRFMELTGGRFKQEMFRNYYDMEYQLMPISDKGVIVKAEKEYISKDVFLELKGMSEKLASPFQFARCDYYVVNNKIYFGEITFFDSGGNVSFDPPEYNQIFGDYWKLD